MMVEDFALIAFQKSRYNETKDYLEEELPCDTELVQKLFPYLNWVIFLMSLSRIPLLALSCYKPRIRKGFLYW